MKGAPSNRIDLKAMAKLTKSSGDTRGDNQKVRLLCQFLTRLRRGQRTIVNSLGFRIFSQSNAQNTESLFGDIIVIATFSLA